MAAPGPEASDPIKATSLVPLVSAMLVVSRAVNVEERSGKQVPRALP